MPDLDGIRAKIASWEGDKARIFPDIYADFTDMILAADDLSLEEIQRLFSDFLGMLFDFEIFKDGGSPAIVINNETSRLDILYNGDTFKIAGQETDLLDVFSMLTETVLEKRGLRRMKSAAETALEITLRIRDGEESTQEESFISDIENIIGIQFVYWIPIDFEIDPVVIYPVSDFKKFEPEDSGLVDEIKTVSGGRPGNMWIFTITDEEDNTAHLALSLDDPDIIFVESQHLKKIHNAISGMTI